MICVQNIPSVQPFGLMSRLSDTLPPYEHVLQRTQVVFESKCPYKLSSYNG